MRVGTFLVGTSTSLETSSTNVDSFHFINDLKLIIFILFVLLALIILLERLAFISVFFKRSSLIIAAFILLVMCLTASECLTGCDSEWILFKVHGLEGALGDQVNEWGLAHLLLEGLWCGAHLQVLAKELFLGDSNSLGRHIE